MGFVEGIENGLIALIFNLIWSALVPAIILSATQEYFWYTVAVVLVFNISFALIGLSDLISSSLGTLIGYGMAIWIASQIDIALFFEMAIPYIGAGLILYLKSKANNT